MINIVQLILQNVRAVEMKLTQTQSFHNSYALMYLLTQFEIFLLYLYRIYEVIYCTVDE